MTIIKREDRDGIAVLTWDQPGSPVNTKSQEALDALAAALSGVLADDTVTGVVLASAKKGFVAGGDLRELRAVTDPDVARGMVAGVRLTLHAMETGGKPVVAALNGATLGGGLELALACHARVADHTALLGLPEVTLGLMPGAGGTQRLPRLVGLAEALPILTSGRPIKADKALEIGLVSQVVDHADLVDAAVSLARTVAPSQPWDGQGSTELSDEDQSLLEKARARAQKRTAAPDLAEPAIVDAVARGLVADFETSLDIEAEAFAGLVVSDAAKNRIRTMFFAMNDAKAIRMRPQDEPTYKIDTIAVVGGGTMGSGIAFTAASMGVNVRLIEVDQAALDRGLGFIAKTAGRQVKAGRMPQDKADAIVARVTGQVGYDNLSDIDAAIEAVVEIEAVKADVFTKLSAAMRPGAPIASNTSTLPITTLASYCARPEDFLGTHFFGPVERMPLVEVIRGEKTTDATLARALDLLKIMRKTPVVVNDGLGFYTSRVVAAYTGEAMTLIAEGVDPQAIDQAATDFGMIIGPCTMNDMTGLPLLTDIFRSAFSDASRPIVNGNRAIEALERLTEAGRTGRRDGAGIYDYAEDKPQPWNGIAELFPANGAPLSQQTITQRLMHAQALETVRAMEDGIVTNASDADVGSVIGWMFPKGMGGVLSYVDTLGAERFVAECDALADTYGGRFAVPQTLRKMAESGDRFHAV
ncbi:3-hydroxyacyl-CoA dehydrogenase NAD-binding domain-containing protein [Ruegeria sp.]|uniref:3-hydroxyacyl-CoA dehydrogenase NAD-binding domain-containing protein n=1 Tax=Ruegeria sp. TaxID=1879320 RepID=UPI003C7EC8BC